MIVIIELRICNLTKNMKDEQKIRKEYKYSTSGVFKKKDPYDPPYGPGSEPYCP